MKIILIGGLGCLLLLCGLIAYSVISSNKDYNEEED